MVSNLKICDDPDLLSKIFEAADKSVFPEFNCHPLYGDFGRALGAAINFTRQQHVLTHFAILEGNEPVLLAPATCDGHSVSMFGAAIQLSVNHSISVKRKKKAFGKAFQRLEEITSKYKASNIYIHGGNNMNPPSDIDLACIKRGAQPELRIHAVVNIEQDEKIIKRNLRKSYRSLVNWGRQNIKTIDINSENPDRGLFEQYSAFHEKIGGVSDYGRTYWDVYWNEIMCDRAELSLGYLDDNHLAVGTLVVFAAETAYYASGVYDRDMFDKPLGHFPVFDAILRASKRGMKIFDLGEIFPVGMATDKEVQIGFFKRGFTSNYILRTNWNLNTNNKVRSL